MQEGFAFKKALRAWRCLISAAVMGDGQSSMANGQWVIGWSRVKRLRRTR